MNDSKKENGVVLVPLTEEEMSIINLALLLLRSHETKAFELNGTIYELQYDKIDAVGDKIFHILGFDEDDD